LNTNLATLWKEKDKAIAGETLVSVIMVSCVNNDFSKKRLKLLALVRKSLIINVAGEGN
jgi:hypothetical protein